MRSCNPARINARTSVVATGKVGQQPVAGKAMGLPGGRGSPIRLVVWLWSDRLPDPSFGAAPSGGKYGQPT
jgi:hypothetical protein